MVCLAPRALGKSVRPRRRSGVVVRPLNFPVRRRNMTLRLRSALCLMACAIAACGAASAPSATAPSSPPQSDGVLIYLGTTTALECFDTVLSKLNLRHDIARQPPGTPTPVATIRWYPTGDAQEKQVACYVNACMDSRKAGHSSAAGTPQCDK